MLLHLYIDGFIVIGTNGEEDGGVRRTWVVLLTILTILLSNMMRPSLIWVGFVTLSVMEVK